MPLPLSAGNPAQSRRRLCLCVPLQRPFVFRPPARVVAVGSFALRAALAPAPTVDLALLMPAACFDNKDQLNHRWVGTSWGGR